MTEIFHTSENSKHFGFSECFGAWSFHLYCITYDKKNWPFSNFKLEIPNIFMHYLLDKKRSHVPD